MSKDSDTEAQLVDENLALQMKEGLAVYKKGFARRVAAYAAIFVVGAVVGAWVFGGERGGVSPYDWESEIASFHAIGATASFTIAHTNAQFGDLELDRDLPDLEAKWRMHMTVRGADVLSVEYEAESGALIKLYRVQTDNADLSEPVIGLRHGLQAATWTKDGVKYLLIGGTDAQLIWNAAKKLSSD